MEATSPTLQRPNDNPAPSSGGNTQRVVVWVLVLLVAAGLFYWVVKSQGGQQAAAQQGKRLAGGPVTVLPATARKSSIGLYQEALGTVTPIYTSSITSQVTGLVVAVHFKEGQMVKKGDALLDIDPRPFEATLAQAQGTLEKDSQTLAQAQMDLERYKAAWARNAVSKQVLDDQEKLVAQQQGLVASDKGLVAYDKVQVGYCHIVAPFNGRVGLRLIDPGNVVQANSTTALAVVTQEQPITVIFTIAEDAIAAVNAELRQHKTLSVDAYDRTAQKKIATGKLLTLDNQIDTTTGTVKLRAQFDNKDGALFPNQFVNTRLLVKTLENVILVPTSAIQRNGQISFVYVLKDGVAQMRNVKPGATDAGMTAVEGLEDGDVVANSSFEKLMPNAQVKLAQAGDNKGGSAK